MKDSIYNGFIASIIEIFIVHPIDVYKTIYQQNNNITLNQFRKKKLNFKYRGFLSRLIGIIPMRTTFWVSQDYAKNCMNNSSNILLQSILVGSFASTCQTLIDTPIENIKINRINKTKVVLNNIYRGFNINLLRNNIFASTVYGFNTMGDKYNINKFVSGSLGGLTGSVISQPIDFVKTILQSNKDITYKDVIFNKQSLKNCMNGTTHRASICFISMGIGSSVFYYLNDN